MIIQEARHFEREHNLESAVNALSPKEKAAKEKLLAAQGTRDAELTKTVSSPGMSNMDTEEGQVPQFLGEVSATSPELHRHLMNGRKDESPASPMPLFGFPELMADLKDLRYTNGNYSEQVQKIAKDAKKAVQKSSSVFLEHVRRMFTSQAPKGKASLANRSGFISAPYLADSSADFKTNVGVACLHPVRESAHLRVSELEAEHMCNDAGLGCSGYSCSVAGNYWECSVCSGVLSKTALAGRYINKKPFFKLKSPDHMEWDNIVRRSRQWVEKFAAIQRQVEDLLKEESRAMERRFQVMLEHRADDPIYNSTNFTNDTRYIQWKVRLDSAWRQEQFEEANWYAELMQAAIKRMDKFYNQVLNKLTNDVNLVNDKEQAKWEIIDAAGLANHSHAFDCWMALRGVVYDFTYLTPHHPNKHSFIKYCGQDISQLYSDLGHDHHSLLALGKRVMGEYQAANVSSSNETRSQANAGTKDADPDADPDAGAIVEVALPGGMVEEEEVEQTGAQGYDYASEIEAEAAQVDHRVNDAVASLLNVAPQRLAAVRPHQSPDVRLLRRAA